MISRELEEYILAHTTPEPPLLRELHRKTHLHTPYPRMMSGPVQGRFLSFISRMIRPGRILEIGTFTGYSTLCLAEGLAPEGLIHTIEAEPAYADIAREYIEKAGLQQKVSLHPGDALQIIPGLQEIFDLVFIDAAKDQYLEYYQAVFEKVKPGGFILADNALWDGLVLEGEKTKDPDTKGIIRFNTFIQADERVENVLVPLRDGVMVIRKI